MAGLTGAARPWGAFLYRDYRMLWVAMFTGTMAVWLRILATAQWLLDETGSAVLVGLIGVVQLVVQIPALLWGGTLADRIDREGDDAAQQVFGFLLRHACIARFVSRGTAWRHAVVRAATRVEPPGGCQHRPKQAKPAGPTKGPTGSRVPGKIRTPDLLIRSQTLYPAELAAQRNTVYRLTVTECQAFSRLKRKTGGEGGIRPLPRQLPLAPA